jgi:transmembrane sensor
MTMGIADDPIEQIAPLDREAQAWVARFASGTATSGDMHALKQWHEQSPAHAEAFARARRLWMTLGSAGDNVRRQTVLPIHPQTPASLPQMLSRRAVMGGALAASAAIAAYGLVQPPFGLWPSFSELTASYRTATGEQKRITLAKASIEMNAQTSIAVRSVKDTDHIELIAGEAAITTGLGALEPLVVTAGNGRIVASQASFDVRYIGATVCVTCLDGALRVEQGGNSTPLQSHQQLLYSSQEISSVRTIDPAFVTAWRDGFLAFNGTPLAEAIE